MKSKQLDNKMKFNTNLKLEKSGYTSGPLRSPILGRSPDVNLHAYASSADPWKIAIRQGKQPETKQARLDEASSQRPSRLG